MASIFSQSALKTDTAPFLFVQLEFRIERATFSTKFRCFDFINSTKKVLLCTTSSYMFDFLDCLDRSFFLKKKFDRPRKYIFRLSRPKMSIVQLSRQTKNFLVLLLAVVPPNCSKSCCSKQAIIII